MVSIIISIYNRPELTRQTLDSLWRSLSHTSIPYDLILVDNGSDPPTKNLLAQYDGFHLITLPKNQGIGAAKNLGVAAALCDLLYISDNDMYFYDGWLETLIKTQRVFPEVKILGAFRHHHHGIQKTHTRSDLHFEQSDQQVGSSWFLTKKTFYQYGPLKEGVSYGLDDTAFCNAVTTANFWVGSIVPHLVYHCGLKNSDGEWSPGGKELYQKHHPKGILVI